MADSSPPSSPSRLDLQDHTHRRLNLLTREWVLVSPHRTKRPWQGQVEPPPPPSLPPYDPSCYLCPGNKRAGGERNPEFTSTFCFLNDFGSLLEGSEPGEVRKGGRDGMGGLLVAKSGRGVCRVMCFSPKHNVTMPLMRVGEIREVVDGWLRETEKGEGMEGVVYVQVFENKGAVMGCSNPHPHCQIWSSDFIPQEIEKEQRSLLEYYQQSKIEAEQQQQQQQQQQQSSPYCLLCDILSLELQEKTRIVRSNASFVLLVPFWATWPFETLLLPRRHLPSFTSLSEKEKNDLAEILSQATVMYDNLFQTPFPYSMGFHQCPNPKSFTKPTTEPTTTLTKEEIFPEWHFHAHYYPPLLRSATVKKFMVGYEMLGNVGRDLTAEMAAKRLRELPIVHYLDKKEGWLEGE